MDRLYLLSFIEQAPVAVAMFDREMHYIAASQRWLDERGLDRSIIGRTAYEVYPDVDAKFRELHCRALAGETVVREEDHFEVAHGSVQWVRSEVRPWYEGDDQIGGIVIFAEDITARKSAEELLRKSEERFRYAMEAARDGIWDWDLETDEVAYSPAYLEILGYSASGWEADTLGSILDFLHPEDRQYIPTLARNLLHSPGRYELEFRLRAKDGSYRYILSRGKTVEWNAQGAPVRAVGTHTDITDRKAIEEALRQREEVVRRQHEELEAIYQSAPIGLASFDRGLRYRRINKRLAEITGLPQAACVDRTIGETLPAMAQSIEEAAKSVLAGEKSVSERELCGETPAQPGIKRYFKDHWYPVFDDRGEIAGCGVVVDEITERKNIEIKLQQATERLELAQSAARIGIWEWNLLTDEAFVNDQWRLIIGVADDVVLSYELFVSRLHPADRDAFLEMVRQAFAGSGAIDGESRIIRADNGETRWVVSKGQVFFDENRKPIRAMGAVWDITSFKQAQEVLLQRSEDRYQRIVETAQEGIWLLDADAKTLFVNPRMARLLGYDKDEMIGRELLDFVDDEWRGMAEKKLVDREAGVIETHDFKFRRKDGADLWALLSCVPIFEGGIYQGALAMVMDFTERKRLEEDRRLYLENLTHMDRRKDEFLATIGHELRTPLATVALAMDIIESDGSLSEKSRAMCLRTQRQVQHLKRIVEDILQVSRLSMGKIDLQKQCIDVCELLVQVKEIFEARFDEAGIILSASLGGETLLLDADEVRLTQTFSNLLDNAAKYTDRGGVVHLEAMRQGDMAVVSIRDTGVGIPKERLAWIFELFNRMTHGPERVRDGIGVGLALARKIVELHGGHIEARSEGAGKGSEFIVRLPLMKQ